MKISPLWILTISFRELYRKMPCEASWAIFNQLSGHKEPILPKTLYVGQAPLMALCSRCKMSASELWASTNIKISRQCLGFKVTQLHLPVLAFLSSPLHSLFLPHFFSLGFILVGKLFGKAFSICRIKKTEVKVGNGQVFIGVVGSILHVQAFCHLIASLTEN